MLFLGRPDLVINHPLLCLFGSWQTTRCISARTGLPTAASAPTPPTPRAASGSAVPSGACRSPTLYGHQASPAPHQGTSPLRASGTCRGRVPWVCGTPAPHPGRPHCPPGARRSLTLLLQGGGVQLQVVQPEAGPGRAPRVGELRPAAPAPQPHRAVVVLGDDGTAAAACGAAGQGGPAPGGSGRTPFSYPGTALSRRPQAALGPARPILSLQPDDPGIVFRTQRGCTGRAGPPLARRGTDPPPPPPESLAQPTAWGRRQGQGQRVPLTDGATGHAGQDAERGRAVHHGTLGPQEGLAVTFCRARRLVQRSRGHSWPAISPTPPPPPSQACRRPGALAAPAQHPSLGRAGSPEAVGARAPGPRGCSSSPASATHWLCSWRSWWKERCISPSSQELGEPGGHQAAAGPGRPGSLPFHEAAAPPPSPGAGGEHPSPATRQPRSTYPWSSGVSGTLRTRAGGWAMSAARTQPVCRRGAAQSRGTGSL